MSEKVFVKPGELPQLGLVEGVIFDMDGLLLDSESLAMQALIESGRALGYEMSMEFCRRMIGVPADGCRTLVRENFGESFPSDAFFDGQEVALRRMVDAGKLTLKEGVIPLLDLLDNLHLPRAIATSSSRIRTDHHLKLVGLFERFDAIVTRDDVYRGKPDPEPYLKAAEALKVPPSRCLALEDSHSGARAAYAAHIRVIVVPDLLEPSEDVREKAWAVVETLHEVAAFLQRGTS